MSCHHVVFEIQKIMLSSRNVRNLNISVFITCSYVTLKHLTLLSQLNVYSGQLPLG